MSKFFTPQMQAWLGGYVPQIADQFAADKRGQAGRETSKRLSAERAEGKPRGGWGDGTIGGLKGAATSDSRRRLVEYKGRRYGFRANSLAFEAWKLIKERREIHAAKLAEMLDVQPGRLSDQLRPPMRNDVIRLVNGFYCLGEIEPLMPKCKGRKEGRIFLSQQRRTQA